MRTMSTQYLDYVVSIVMAFVFGTFTRRFVMSIDFFLWIDCVFVGSIKGCVDTLILSINEMNRYIYEHNKMLISVFFINRFID